jgi:hypothetical protein
MTQSEQTRGPKGEAFAQSRRLVARSSPEAGESLYGWAVRLADANGYANARAILSLAKRGASAPSAGILSNRLAQLVDGSLSDFERYVAAKWNGHPCYHGLELGVAMPYFDIRPKVCPACLAERSVLKSVWNLRIWHYCPQHFCRLIQICPFCCNRLARGQRAVTHCGNKLCNADLSKCAGDPIPREVVNIVGMLGDVSRRFRHLPESLSDASLPDLVRLIYLFSTPLLHVRNEFWQRGKASIRERLTIAEDALNDWPHGYVRYLHSIRHSKSERWLLGKSGLRREFPFFVANLKHGGGIADAMLDVLKEELANYVEGHVPSATAARFTITGKPSRFLTIQQAIREFGLSQYKVVQAQREGSIQTIAAFLPTKQRHFVERDHILAHSNLSDIFRPNYAFKAKYNLISFINAARLLQVSNPVIRSLIQAGYIETLTHFGKTWCKVDSINGLLTKLANVAMHAIGDENRRSELGRSQCVTAAKITDVLERALNGQLQLTLQIGYRGLRGFLFDRDDLTKLFPVAPDGYLSLHNAARYPHWTEAYLRTSIRSGLLPSVEHPRKGRMIEVHALAKFRENYVNTNELQEVYGISRSRISLELVDSTATVSYASKIRVWRREPALAILDRKFHRIEKSIKRATQRKLR